MGKTTIQWTHFTFNAWIGCSHKPKHPGCAHCYAEAEQDGRRHRVAWGPKGTRSMTTPHYWKQPIAWNALAKSTGRRKRVFCASLADVFEDWHGVVTQRWHTHAHGISHAHERVIPMSVARTELFTLIDATPYLDWLLLTKRPENVEGMWIPRMLPNGTILMYRKNVWLGTSVSDQTTADQYIPELLKLRGLACVLFVSAEPLLGPVTLNHIKNAESGAALDWLIIGGESGVLARRFDIAWARRLIVECRSAGVPAFYKQGGTSNACKHDTKGGCFACFPDDLRVREFPA